MLFNALFDWDQPCWRKNKAGESIFVFGITQYICYRYYTVYLLSVSRFDILFDDLVFSVYFVVYIIRFKLATYCLYLSKNIQTYK